MPNGVLKPLIKILAGNKDAINPATSFPLFLKRSTASSYFTGEAPSAGWDNSLLTELEGILDKDRRQNLQDTKVILSIQETDQYIKSLHRTVDIWSFLNWSVGSIWSALDKLMNSISDRLSTAEINEANDVLDFLSVSDTALKHGLGETAYSYTNMVHKKRSQILSFSSRDVSKVHKAALLYSPVDGPKIFPDEVVRQTAVSVGETSKHDFFVDAKETR